MDTTIKEFSGTHRWLSNFEGPPVKLDGITYPRVENAYQAAKTLDLELRKPFLAATASYAKHLGKNLLLREDWSMVRVPIMTKLVREKFLDLKYMELLLGTGEADLIEGNYWHDNFWGNCYCPKCKDISGRNTLGRILSQIRAELANFKIVFESEE